MNAIEAKHLTKQYRNALAVDDLNLEVHEGELFALLGVNGAGKTTTIKMLACLTKPTSGTAVLMGHSILDQTNAVKQCINLSPQETAVARNLTVLENLKFVCGIYGMDAGQTAQRIEQTIHEFSLESVLKKKAKTLSGGWSRRLSIAMAMITQPQILFLDEPTLGLDVLARRELWHTITALKGKTTVILTTHYLEEAKALSDRIGIMAKGRLVAVGTAEQLMKQCDTDDFETAFVSLCGGEQK